MNNPKSINFYIWYFSRFNSFLNKLLARNPESREAILNADYKSVRIWREHARITRDLITALETENILHATRQEQTEAGANYNPIQELGTF